MPKQGLFGTSRSLVFAAALLALPAARAQATGVKGVVGGPNGPVAGDLHTRACLGDAGRGAGH